MDILTVCEVFIWISGHATSAFPQPKGRARYICLVHARSTRLSDDVVTYATSWFTRTGHTVLIAIGDLVAAASALHHM